MHTDIKLGHITAVFLRNILSDERFIGSHPKEVLYFDECNPKYIVLKTSTVFWHKISITVFAEAQQTPCAD